MEIHSKIVKLRKDRGWKQQELSRQIGIHVAHLSRIETGKSMPSVELLYKLAKALGVSMDYLVGLGGDEVSLIEIKNKTLAEKIEVMDRLDEKDQQTIINVIEAMLTKQKLKEFVEKELSN